MNIKRPNLFSYATSELSQDAFICWLLAWASPEYSNTDRELHRCALNCIHAFYKKHNKPIPSAIEKVEIFKQNNNIDVLCIVNDKHAILIEDKTNTENHSNQLRRYLG